MNIGHHAHLFKNKEYANKIASAANQNFDQFIWKTTTISTYDFELDYYDHDYVMCSIEHVICFNTSWTHKLLGHSTEYMWDVYHFYSLVYNILNTELMLVRLRIYYGLFYILIFYLIYYI
jgi:hypothetical protein